MCAAATAFAILFVLQACEARAASSQAEGDEASKLAKETQNPVADLISVPFQSNFNFKTGSEDKTVYILNIQPVIPFELNEDWNLITRTVMPLISQPQLFPGLDSTTGLGDINPTFFLAPAKPGKWIWGIGPTFQLPTHTDDELGSNKWCAGPGAVLLTMQGPWVYGALVNNLTSFGGSGDKVNKMLIQPFLNYNMPKGWYLTSSPIITADWEASDGDKWTVPVGGGIGRIFKAGKLPVNAMLAGYYNAIRPEYGSEWQLRFQLQFLFPK